MFNPQTAQESAKEPDLRKLRLVAWESTRACKFSCKHCRATAQTSPDPKQLSTSEIKGLIDDISRLVKPILIITGGDPLLRDDVYEVAEYATDRGLHVAMALNGQVDRKTASAIRSAGVKRVSLSLDGSKPSIHDEFRGIEGAFEMAMRTAESVKAEGLPFRILTTVTKHNIHDLTDIHKLVTDLGAESWDVFMLVPTGRARSDMEVTPAEYETVLGFVRDLSRRSGIPVKLTCAPHYNRLMLQSKGLGESSYANICQEMTRLKIGRGCLAGDGFCFISHVGEVYGCGYLPISGGNIREKRFSEIYTSSPFFIKLRDRRLLKGKCRICAFREACGGCRARAYSIFNDFLAQEPYCTYEPSATGQSKG